jgi:hypothetical protein
MLTYDSITAILPIGPSPYAEQVHLSVKSRIHQSFFLVEVRLELTQFLVRKTGELERVCTHGSRVTSIEATGEDSRENHACRRNTGDLEAARAARSEAELSAIERLAAHVVIVLRNRVKRVHLAALVDAAAGNDTTKDTADDAASKVGTGTEDTVTSKAFAVKTLLSFDRGGKDHGKGNEGVDRVLHFG